MTTQPRAADAVDLPCVMRKSHNPTPIRTQSHHRYFQYLQERLWGEVRLQERLDLCGTDHDSVHAWVAYLLDEQYKPQIDPGTLVKAEAQLVMNWYRAEQAKLAAAPAFGDGTYGSGPFGDAQLGDASAQWDGVE